MKRKALKVIEEEVISEEASPKEETPVLPEPTTIVNDAADAPDIADTTDTTSKRRKKKTRRPVFSDTIPAIPVASFHRLAREMAENCRADLRWEADALQALQVAAEAFMVEKFKKAGEMECVPTTQGQKSSSTSRPLLMLVKGKIASILQWNVPWNIFRAYLHPVSSFM
jgi:histone H3/H4